MAVGNGVIVGSNTAGGGGTLTFNLSAAVPSGALLVVVVCARAGSPTTFPSVGGSTTGRIAIGSFTTNDGDVWVYGFVSDGTSRFNAGSTVSINWNGSGVTLEGIYFTGVNTTTPTANVASGGTGTGVSSTIGGFTSGDAIMLAAASAAKTTYPTSSNTTLLQNLSGGSGGPSNYVSTGTFYATDNGTFSLANLSNGTHGWVGFRIVQGATTPTGSASGTVAAAGSATGSTAKSGAASGTVAAAGSATGARVSSGSAAGTVSAAGTADGTTPLVLMDGSAAGTVAAAGTATGQHTASGAASGSLTAAGAASGEHTPSGSAAGTLAAAGAADGTAPAGQASPALWVASSGAFDGERTSASFPSHPSGVVDGDVIVVAIHHWGQATEINTEPAGFVHLGGATVIGTRFGSNAIRTDLYAKRVASGDPANYSFTFAQRWGSQAALYFTDVDPGDDLTALAVNFATSTTASTTIPTASVTAADGDGLAWFVNATDEDSDVAFTPPTGFTERTDGQWHAAASLDDAGAGTVSASGASMSRSNNVVVGLVALPGVPGATTPEGDAAGTLTVAGSATGSRVSAGTAEGVLESTGAATGSTTHEGSAAGAVAAAGAADGTTPAVGGASGSAAGTVDAAGSATGSRASGGTAAGAVDLAGSATGSRASQGTASGTVDLAGAAAGSSAGGGTAAGTVLAAGTATGSTIMEGTASGGVTAAGSASGFAPVVGANQGTAAGQLSLAGAAEGARVSEGSGSGTVALAGAAAGSTVHAGSATGSAAAAGAADGTAPTVAGASGAAQGALTAAGQAQGSTVHEGDAAGALGVTAAPSGYAPVVGASYGVASGTVAVAGLVVGSDPDQPPVGLRWDGAGWVEQRRPLRWDGARWVDDTHTPERHTREGRVQVGVD